MQTVRGQVEDLREREFERHVEVELVEPEAFEARVDGVLDPGDEREQLLLRAIDAIPRDGVLSELTGDQSGFFGSYFYGGNVLVASEDPDEPGAMDRVVIAHELGQAPPGCGRSTERIGGR